MKKIVGYIAVFLIFSWVSTANAGPLVATITNSNGDLTISGFSSTILSGTPADLNPNTLNFLFDFTPGSSGLVNVFSSGVHIGGNYDVHVGFTIPALPIPGLPAPNPGPVFSADFSVTSLFDFAPGAPFPTSVDNVLNGLINGGTVNFTPTNAFLTINGDTMQLLTVHVGGVLGAPTLELSTLVTSGTKLIDYLNQIDESLTGGANGIVSTAFTNAHAEVRVPEPATLLLLGSGLLGLRGFSKRRA